ncbi:hypothetical protein [Glaciihabitans sp. dw_435]|uniref:hypothetical protein n=1 Tax=Glaciihabitans sp. dw_435 TaxID=2720081 RepID=UPI001BD634EA|nr:hypothetical protein [Glaciihabitans sp. dw_435]
MVKKLVVGRMTRVAATLAGLVFLAALTGCTAPAPTPVPTQQPTRAATAHPVVTSVAVTPPAPDANELARLRYSSGSSTITSSVTIVSPGVSSYAVTFACNSRASGISFSYAITLDGADFESASITCDSELHKDVAAVALPKGSSIQLTMDGDFDNLDDAFVVVSRE